MIFSFLDVHMEAEIESNILRGTSFIGSIVVFGMCIENVTTLSHIYLLMQRPNLTVSVLNVCESPAVNPVWAGLERTRQRGRLQCALQV